MARTKELVTAVGTLACALGIGFVMQSTETANQRYGASGAPKTAPVTTPQPVRPATPEQEQVSVIDVQGVTLTSALPALGKSVLSNPVASQQKAPPEALVHQVAATEAASGAATDIACDMSAAATPTLSARANLSLHAPCHGDQRVTVHHGGMFFTEKTSADGSLQLTVPGLAEEAVFIFAFGDGNGAIAQTELSDIANFNRVVLQWHGQAGFELHAREFGAAYGSEGHVWHGADIETTRANLKNGTGGALDSLGQSAVEEPHFVEIYSFPATMSGRNGQIDLSVEAEITTANCGQEIEAKAMEREGDGTVLSKTLTLAVPGCEAVGDFLVLNNVLDDMKVAAR